MIVEGLRWSIGRDRSDPAGVQSETGASGNFNERRYLAGFLPLLSDRRVSLLESSGSCPSGSPAPRWSTPLPNSPLGSRARARWWLTPRHGGLSCVCVRYVSSCIIAATRSLCAISRVTCRRSACMPAMHTFNFLFLQFSLPMSNYSYFVKTFFPNHSKPYNFKFNSNPFFKIFSVLESKF